MARKTWWSECSFLGRDGKPTDPPAVNASVRHEGVVIASYSYAPEVTGIVRDAKGLYHLNVITNGGTLWAVDWEGIVSDDLVLTDSCGWVVPVN